MFPWGGVIEYILTLFIFIQSEMGSKQWSCHENKSATKTRNDIVIAACVFHFQSKQLIARVFI